MLILALKVSTLLDATVSLGSLFHWVITSGKNEFASWFVEMKLDTTSYCSSWDRRSLDVFLDAYLSKSRSSSPLIIL